MPGLVDEGEVGDPFPQRGGHGDHRDVEPLDVDERRDGAVATGGERRGDLVVADVLDVRAAVGQRLGAVLVDVVADHVVAGGDRPHRERQSHVALADDERGLGHPPIMVSARQAQVGDRSNGYTCGMLWTVFIILGIIAFALIILGRRRV